MDSTTKTQRFAMFLTAAVFGFFLIEDAIANAKERKEAFAKWRAGFVAQFTLHEGRLEWLRDTLVKEEMSVRATTDTDCGCDDARS